MTTSYKLTIKTGEINAAAQRAFSETAFLLGREFTRVISEPRTWDGFEGKRDIVDTGVLRASQQLVFPSPFTAVYSWPVEYAAYVHEGYTLRNGRELKGRPWTEIAQVEFDVEATFAERYRANLDKI